MFFLLPQKTISEPIVNNFKTSLSQITETNYFTLPLYNLASAINLKPNVPVENPETTKPLPLIRKSIAATKSKPTSLTLPTFTSCPSYGMNFPLNIQNDEKNAHVSKCKQKPAEKETMVLEKSNPEKEKVK